MNYAQAREYIDAAAVRGSVLGLDTMRELMLRLSNVQDGLRFIHIAGTNGKGSTAAFITSILIESGLKVGSYSSPSVFSYLEKIKLGRRNVSQKKFAAAMSCVAKAAEKMVNKPTVFEMETAAAFLIFSEEKCDVVVLECGLGGAEDATNIVKTTILSVFTSISLDHVKILGPGLGDIAGVKAGILKKGIPAVSIAQEEEAEKVLKSRADLMGSELSFIRPDEETRLIRDEYGDLCYSFDNGEFSIEDIRLRLSGLTQLENSALALGAAMKLTALEGFEGINPRTIKKGLLNARHPGRLEEVFYEEKCQLKPSRRPRIIIDGAHNEDAALRLAESVRKYFNSKKLIFIMGVLADKDYEKICRIMVPLADSIITLTPPENSRALDSYELAKCVQKYNNNVSQASSVEEALEMALLFAEKKDIILAFGSLSYLGRLKKAIAQI